MATARIRSFRTSDGFRFDPRASALLRRRRSLGSRPGQQAVDGPQQVGDLVRAFVDHGVGAGGLLVESERVDKSGNENDRERLITLALSVSSAYSVVNPDSPCAIPVSSVVKIFARCYHYSARSNTRK